MAMSQQQKDALKEMIRNAPLDIGGDAIEQRANFEKMLSAQPLADDVSTTPGELGGVPVLNIETGEASHDAVMLWFHGGWYVIGSPRTSAGLSSDLARRVDAKVISVDYRLAPEHPYPAALQDATAAYRGLLDSGVDPRSIAIVGESAGGGLAVALLASLAENGLAQPAAAFLLSPWTDLALSGETMTSEARRAAIDDVDITLDVTPGVPHGFQAFAAILDEGDAALARAAAFLDHHLSWAEATT
jgi:epsilon-lactone hydrolase